MICSRKLADAVCDADRQIEDTVVVASGYSKILMNGDVVVASGCCANIFLAVAYQAVWPFEIDVLYSLPGLLVHDVGKGRRGGRHVGYREILLHCIACEKQCEIEHLRKRIIQTLWRYR